MKTIFTLAFAVMLAAAPFSYAADLARHEEHHPATPLAKAAPNKTAKAPGASNEQMENMDAKMKTMREMHDKMMAAKTPEERNALMAEHMKGMQDSMSMMNGMMGGKASKMQPMSSQMMQKQMEMMQVMMQMMMDRMGPPARDK